MEILLECHTFLCCCVRSGHGMRLFQHGLCKNTVASCRVIDQHMGHCTHQPSVLQDGTAAHPLHDAAGLRQQCRVGDAQHHVAARVGVVHLFNIDTVAAGLFAAGGGQDLCRAGQHLLRKGKLCLLPGNGGAYRAVNTIFAVDADPSKGVVAEEFAFQLSGAAGGTAGSPGELKGKFLSDHALGRICINGENGVYGTVSTAIAGQQTELAFAQEVLPGAAEILTTTSGEKPRSYRVYIEKVNDADPRRNMVLRVTDPALLAQTGGIVQGMSGSPILQNGRLVGAVTHVLVNDPTRGYGIFAQTMLEQAHSVPGTDAAA